MLNRGPTNITVRGRRYVRVDLGPRVDSGPTLRHGVEAGFDRDRAQRCVLVVPQIEAPPDERSALTRGQYINEIKSLAGGRVVGY
jgi:hypothetical protein